MSEQIITQIDISFTMPAGAPICCCGEITTCNGCACLPDELELEFSVCGRTWIEVLTSRGASLGNKAWQTKCDIQYYTECPDCLEEGVYNTMRCIVFWCTPNIEGTGENYYVRFGSSCPGVDGNCNDAGHPYNWPHTDQTTDPWSVTFGTLGLSLNVCCDDPPCNDAPVIIIRIPNA